MKDKYTALTFKMRCIKQYIFFNFCLVFSLMSIFMAYVCKNDLFLCKKARFVSLVAVYAHFKLHPLRP